MLTTRRRFLESLAGALGAAAVAPLVARAKIPGWEDLPEIAPPDAAPLTEDESRPAWTRVNQRSDVKNDSTFIEIDDATFFRVDDAALCARTGEIMRVVSVRHARGGDLGALSVVRATAGTTLAGLLDLDWLMRLAR